jgi:hypothetical protein
MALYGAWVRSIKAGQVGVLAPSDGESTRAILVRVGRAAAREDLTVESWSDGAKVYFKRA